MNCAFQTPPNMLYKMVFAFCFVNLQKLIAIRLLRLTAHHFEMASKKNKIDKNNKRFKNLVNNVEKLTRL